MQPLRWKSRYRSGDKLVDQDNKAVVECLNTLLDATKQRDHCSSVEELLDALSDNADSMLRSGKKTAAIKASLREQLLHALPLSNYGGQSCHACGICDLAKKQIEHHLQAPAICMALQEATPE